MAIAVSDGSYKEGFGTSAWVIQGKDENHEARGVNVVPGHTTDQSAYRSKLAGIHGIVAFANQWCSLHDITEGSIEIGCDGISALEAIYLPNVVTSKTKHFDLITSTRQLLARSPLTWKHRHVHGHQDEVLGQHLDRWAKLNIEMDIAAKAYWEEATTARSQALQCIHGEPWSLWIDGRKICQNLREQVYDAVHAPKIAHYWTNRKRPRLTTTQYTTVDWEGMAKAMKAAPTHVYI